VHKNEREIKCRNSKRIGHLAGEALGTACQALLGKPPTACSARAHPAFRPHQAEARVVGNMPPPGLCDQYRVNQRTACRRRTHNQAMACSCGDNLCSNALSVRVGFVGLLSITPENDFSGRNLRITHRIKVPYINWSFFVAEVWYTNQTRPIWPLL
jgi:hypothetical protein